MRFFSCLNIDRRAAPERSASEGLRISLLELHAIGKPEAVATCVVPPAAKEPDPGTDVGDGEHVGRWRGGMSFGEASVRCRSARAA